MQQQQAMVMNPIFANNIEASRFEYQMDGKAAFASYRRNGNVLFIDHVEAPEALRSKGAAGTLMKHIYDRAVREGWKIVPICSYAATWLRRHEDAQKDAQSDV